MIVTQDVIKKEPSEATMEDVEERMSRLLTTQTPEGEIHRPWPANIAMAATGMHYNHSVIADKFHGSKISTKLVVVYCMNVSIFTNAVKVTAFTVFP